MRSKQRASAKVPRPAAAHELWLLLPPPAAAPGLPAVPLAEQTLVWMAEALVSPEPDRPAALSEALRTSASLAARTVSAAWLLSGAEPRTHAEAAQWLSSDWPERLGLPTQELEPVPASLAERCQALARAYRSAADAAESLARAAALPDSERASLLAALALAPRSLPEPPSAAEVAARQFPLGPWWLEQLAEVSASSASALPTLAGCVAAALTTAQAPAAADLPGPRLAPRLLRAAALQARRLRALEADQQQALETLKLQALKEFAYGAGHELNNPLANIAARAQTLLLDETDAERRQKLAAINAQAMRAHEMIADLMLFARPPRPAPQRVELCQLVRAAAARLAPRAAAQQTALRLELPAPDAWIVADPRQLAVALGALGDNALESLGMGGQVTLALHLGPGIELEGRPAVRLSVADTGPGIAPAARQHLFDPFFSGREAGRGLGLGLAKCWRIITDHGGRIEVHSQGGAGAELAILLPVEPALGNPPSDSS